MPRCSRSGAGSSSSDPLERVARFNLSSVSGGSGAPIGLRHSASPVLQLCPRAGRPWTPAPALGGRGEPGVAYDPGSGASRRTRPPPHRHRRCRARIAPGDRTLDAHRRRARDALCPGRMFFASRGLVGMAAARGHRCRPGTAWAGGLVARCLVLRLEAARFWPPERVTTRRPDGPTLRPQEGIAWIRKGRPSPRYGGQNPPSGGCALRVISSTVSRKDDGRSRP